MHRGTNTSGIACPIEKHVAGHLIAHALGGKPKAKNIVALTISQNRDHTIFENNIVMILSDLANYANELISRKKEGSLVPILQYVVEARGQYTSVEDTGWIPNVDTTARLCILKVRGLLCTGTLNFANGSYSVNPEVGIPALQRLQRQDREYRKEDWRYRCIESYMRDAEFAKNGQRKATIYAF